MATPSEILGSEIRRGDISPGERPYAVWDTTQGLTDELRNANIMKILGEVGPLKDAVYNPDAAVPSLADVLSFYGLKDSEDKKAVDKFLESFSKKLPQWKKQALDDPKWGKSGWETIKKIYQQAEKDKMYENIAENRRKIAHGTDEEGLDWLATKAANIMFPRATKAVEEGRDPTASEWGRDVGANALYAVPFGSITKPLTYGRPLASKILGWGANAVAPATVATVDNIADPENRDFDEWSTDFLIGTGANIGLNKALAPILSRMLNAGKIRGGISPAVRAALEGNPTELELARDAVAAAKEVLKNPASSTAEREAAAEIINLARVAESGAVKSIAPAVKEARSAAKQSAKANKAALKSGAPLETSGLDEAKVVGDELDQFFYDVTPEGITPPKYSEVLAKKPGMTALFLPEEPFFKVARPTPAGIITGLKSEVGNQIGSNFEKAQDVGLGVLPGTSTSKEMQEKTNKNRAEKQRKAKVSEILSAPTTDEEDAKWLTIVRDNPKVLQFGYADDPEGFKRWLLERGSDLLRGTPLYRPAWEAE